MKLIFFASINLKFIVPIQLPSILSNCLTFFLFFFGLCECKGWKGNLEKQNRGVTLPPAMEGGMRR